MSTTTTRVGSHPLSNQNIWTNRRLGRHTIKPPSVYPRGHAHSHAVNLQIGFADCYTREYHAISGLNKPSKLFRILLLHYRLIEMTRSPRGVGLHCGSIEERRDCHITKRKLQAHPFKAYCMHAVDRPTVLGFWHSPGHDVLGH